jgi:hypothetical protein
MSEPAPKPAPKSSPQAAPKKSDDDDRLYGGFYEHSTAGSMPPAPFPAKGKPSSQGGGPAAATGAQAPGGGSAIARFFRRLLGR